MARLSGLVRRRRMVLSTLGLAETMPAALRPSLVIQRRAISNGLLGDSVFWKIVAVALFLRGRSRAPSAGSRNGWPATASAGSAGNS